MNIEIKKLNSKLIDDYISFFQNIRITDDPECGKCHCLFFHTEQKAKEWIKRTSDQNKETAINSIKEGILSGFLAYEGIKPIAWCNVNSKEKFNFNKSRFYNNLKKNNQIISIVCFYVLKEFRKKGITTQLLKNIIEYYKNSHYKCIEAYPSINESDDIKNYHGPLDLFLKMGFNIIKHVEETDDFGDNEKYAIVRYNI